MLLHCRPLPIRGLLISKMATKLTRKCTVYDENNVEVERAIQEVADRQYAGLEGQSPPLHAERDVGAAGSDRAYACQLSRLHHW